LRHSSIVVQMEKVGAKSVAVDDQIGAVSHRDLVDLGEQLVRRMPGEDIREPGLDAHADQRQPARLLPLAGHRELLVTELDPGLLVRRLGVRLRQRHGHVDVVGPGREGAVEDRHVEDRVDGVHHVRDAVLAAQRLDGRGVGRVDLRGDVPAVGGRPLLGAGRIVVGDDDRLEEVAPSGDGRERPADAAGADQQDPHSVPAFDWEVSRRLLRKLLDHRWLRTRQRLSRNLRSRDARRDHDHSPM
jgi:hypothetical protein